MIEFEPNRTVFDRREKKLITDLESLEDLIFDRKIFYQDSQPFPRITNEERNTVKTSKRK